MHLLRQLACGSPFPATSGAQVTKKITEGLPGDIDCRLPHNASPQLHVVAILSQGNQWLVAASVPCIKLGCLVGHDRWGYDAIGHLCSGVWGAGGAGQGGRRLRSASLVIRRVDHPVGVKRARRFRHEWLANRDAPIFGTSEWATGGWHHRVDRRLSGTERWGARRRQNGPDVSWQHGAIGPVGIGW